jgi:hypothetical protein
MLAKYESLDANHEPGDSDAAAPRRARTPQPKQFNRKDRRDRREERYSLCVLCGYDSVGLLRAGQRNVHPPQCCHGGRAAECRAEEFSANLGEPLQCNTPEPHISSKIVGEAI